jgi:hypothetical protein
MLSLPSRALTPFGDDVRAAAPVSAAFSRDGHWLAYSVTNSQGRSNRADDAINTVVGASVFVEPFPPTGEKHLISSPRGVHPVWSPTGKELFFISPGQLWSVEVATQPRFSFGPPKVIPRVFREQGPRVPREYDVTADGQKFIGAFVPGVTSGPAQLHVVVNWFAALRRRMASS